MIDAEQLAKLAYECNLSQDSLSWNELDSLAKDKYMAFARYQIEQVKAEILKQSQKAVSLTSGRVILRLIEVIQHNTHAEKQLIVARLMHDLSLKLKEEPPDCDNPPF
ncbi:hypothetical protein [Cylindrospermum sp. FACHB-282]|uniref:hypothetical protein n=1 Tax=Cylindrospermum sp. FACHB-282 TaxID=2692794 RepID=UPI0016855FFF|nr:hypothetical protein [Cylindrospermum sp. FACHB-282]MBD2388876.1 hypothetical protein [Cylindrospermum sp. FACHB-282]